MLISGVIWFAIFITLFLSSMMIVRIFGRLARKDLTRIMTCIFSCSFRADFVAIIHITPIHSSVSLITLILPLVIATLIVGPALISTYSCYGQILIGCLVPMHWYTFGRILSMVDDLKVAPCLISLPSDSLTLDSCVLIFLFLECTSSYIQYQ